MRKRKKILQSSKKAFSLFFLLLVSAEAFETNYKWIMLSQNRGQCMEVDKETLGKAYANKVSKDKCRPKQVSYLWEQIKPMSGQCFLVDAQSKGKIFKDRARYTACLPQEHVFVSHAGSCYVADALSEGKKFFHKVAKKNCIPADISYQWSLDTKKLKGTCWAIGKGYRKSVNHKKCLPQETFFKFVGEYCYEVSAKGASNYIKKVSWDRCRKKSIGYFWNEESCYEKILTVNDIEKLLKVSQKKCFPKSQKKLPKKLLKEKKVLQAEKLLWIPGKDGWGGKCYKTQVIAGKLKKIKLMHHRCRPKKTLYKWKSLNRLSGLCYEVGELIGEQFYAAEVKNYYCRPSQEKVIYFYERNLETSLEGSCFRIDKKTQGRGFSERVTPSFCKRQMQQQSLDNKYDSASDDKDAPVL